MAVEPTDGQIEAFKIAWNEANARGEEHHRVEAGLRAALNYEEPYTEEDKKYDFALATTDAINGDGAYAGVNRDNPNPMVQRAIRRWREKQ